jgi:hypothetical protein
LIFSGIFSIIYIENERKELKNMRKNWYDVPTQVIFVDVDDNLEVSTIGGIAYGDVVICGECGCTICLEDLYTDYDAAVADGVEVPDAPIYELPWISIDEAIAGNGADKYEFIYEMKED